MNFTFNIGEHGQSFKPCDHLVHVKHTLNSQTTIVEYSVISPERKS